MDRFIEGRQIQDSMKARACLQRLYEVRIGIIDGAREYCSLVE